MERYDILPRAAGLHDLIPSEQRGLIELPADRGRATGIGVVTKWNPAVLDEKTQLENDLMMHLARQVADQFAPGEQRDLAMSLAAKAASDQALVMLAKRGIGPEGVAVSRNILVNTGLTDIGNGLTSSGLSTPYTNANSYLGVGDSTTAAAVSQTDVQAATNKLRKAMDATYPTVANGVYTWRSTFATTDANFAWQEWAVFNASTAGRMFNRAVSSLGTKTSAQSWQLTGTMTIA